MNNVFPWLNLARHQALQMIFHLIWQNKTRLYTSPIVFLSYFRNHIDIQRTFATLHSHWKLAHKRRCVDKMLNDLLAFGPDFLFLYFSIFFCLNFMPYVLCNGEECLLPCNVVRCVVVRTDKTEYMVMQVRGWGQELVILLPGKNKSCKLIALADAFWIFIFIKSGRKIIHFNIVLRVFTV